MKRHYGLRHRIEQERRARQDGRIALFGIFALTIFMIWIGSRYL